MPEGSLVDFLDDLVDALESLTTALDDQGTDLLAILSVLTDDVVAAVPSYLGLTATVYLGDEAITVGTINSASAETSILLPVETTATIAHCEIVLYAGVEGAFAALAADVRAADPTHRAAVFDAHLPPPTARLYSSDAVGVARILCHQPGCRGPDRIRSDARRGPPPVADPGRRQKPDAGRHREIGADGPGPLSARTDPRRVRGEERVEERPIPTDRVRAHDGSRSPR